MARAWAQTGKRKRQRQQKKAVRFVVTKKAFSQDNAHKKGLLDTERQPSFFFLILRLGGGSPAPIKPE